MVVRSVATSCASGCGEPITFCGGWLFCVSFSKGLLLLLLLGQLGNCRFLGSPVQISPDSSEGAVIKDADPTSTLESHAGRFQASAVLQPAVVDSRQSRGLDLNCGTGYEIAGLCAKNVNVLQQRKTQELF